MGSRLTLVFLKVGLVCPRHFIFAVFIFFISLVFVPQPPMAQAAVASPPLISPSDGSTTDVNNYPPLGVPDFVWSSVGGTTSYRLQVSSDIGFASTILDITTPNTQYTPLNASPFSDGLWYWHVRVEAPSIGTYSSTFTFTKNWASGSNLPALSSPADSATLEFYDSPIFSWQPITGAAKYNFQIDANPPNFSTPDYNAQTLDFVHQPVAKQANGSYSWRVVPVDPANRNGTPSLVRSFTQNYNQIPTQLLPADLSNPTFTPTFSWTAVRGAQFYRLQYSTDNTFSTNTQVDTFNTTYTPSTALPNDVNFYWHVRALSGNSIASWSPTFSFVKKWYLQPTLLTPVNLYQFTSEPFFSWTPVPGAARYQIEVSSADSFPPVGGFTDFAVNPFYVRPFNSWEGLASPYTWYWRVTPIDGNNNAGLPSNVSSFVNPPSAPVAPRQIYPSYYFTPTASISITPMVGFRPREDRTIPEPVFMWHRFFTTTAPITQVNAYRIQVSANGLWTPPSNIKWQFDTNNLSASPTSTNPFTPTIGGIYSWRVSALDAVGGNPIGQWSQVWKTRIDTTLITNTTSNVTLLRPINGYESVETDPMLEWYPTMSADSYDVQISTDNSAFDSNIVISATVPYPVYTPPTRLIYNGGLPYGTFYWRVRARSGGAPLGSFSRPWRFQVAAQSHWKEPRTVGSNQLQIAADAAGDMTDPNYDVTGLYAGQSSNYWYFGFNATGSSDVVYGMYLDLDHVDGSGGTSDPYGLNIATIPAHQPEFAIYAIRSSGVFSADNTYIYSWSPGARPTRINEPARPASWGSPLQLSAIGGALYYSPTINYVELQIPNTAIGMQGTTGSAAISLFTAPAAGGHAQDTVPSDPNVAYITPDLTGATTTLSRFASVSERLTLTMPPNNISGDPTNFPSVPPFLWQLPVDDSWIGYNLQVHTDAQYTSQILDYTVQGSSLIPPDYTHNNGDLNGDNTYYWRVRPVYNSTGNPKGAWSQGTAFDRQGFVLGSNAYTPPTGIMTSTISFATPSFVWDMVEGAEAYDIQVDDDPAFGSLAVNATTNQTSFTPTGTLGNGTYYWRVRVRRSNSVFGNWSPSQSFTLNLPQPSGLTPSGGVANRAPTFCWTPLIVSSGGNPVMAAYRYRVQVSNNDPTFSTVYDAVDTEQACWTPTKGYVEGTLDWRVAMLDGQGLAGAYSPYVSFTKQYPITTLLSPVNGGLSLTTPTFIWTPVYGAASYRIQVSTSVLFSPLTDNQTTNNTHYTPTTTYAKNTYYWRVAVVDSDGIQGPYNTATILVGGSKIYLPLIIR